ncbi:hypothetical protein BHU32_06295 [Fructilactobacillus sanfranciscensis DSM 20451]|nr:hypothetical protein FD36_GL000407 [Fructilactobacillus sanfranciscensis DSM 20451]POH23659.1 hypothetical protein BHU32_06295 [Fructilactobacillus sanfranciscensis DSM 20451]
MFLAWKEIKHDKLRYGLITLMIMLVGYLIFILTSLAIGLAGQNTQAINTWEPQSIVLNKDANINISQSKIMTDQVRELLYFDYSIVPRPVLKTIPFNSVDNMHF